jgi:hypothetical protein
MRSDAYQQTEKGVYIKQSIANFLLSRLEEAGIRHIFGVFPGTTTLS